ncbi:3D (Asp-Asp-Asp) domain-containing protein [Cerasibacillus quisquiliarum]|uniref:Peptidase M23 n=1 Tax=Cerasibacillus quisquiliarum TaxID=227865 RepID=A0A511V2Q1_9BACI|nr:3D domain-containing protein [Cerasibacillus quisquiliarum]MBB5146053.1 3D (Asp-Asp-Asp) domain-containing protein [Cerasibacillus quisquiliarum]GEN32168.1 peptidase M23 [Cerasibacillus quisquiliarum]
MKKIFASMSMGLLLVGASLSTASAEDYSVQKGDNLWTIANQFELTVDQLIEMNNLDTTVIQPKQKLVVQEAYTVKKDDTLYGIAKAHHVTVDELKEWNGLDSDIILVGQKLHMKSEGHEIKNESMTRSKQPKQQSKQVKEKATGQQEKNQSNRQEQPEGKTLTVTATAYTAQCKGCSGVTATGINLNHDRNKKVIAVDPNVIPLGSRVHVEGYGYAIAGDTGGAIKGNKIDIHVPTKQEAKKWGVRTVKVTVLDK